MSESKFQSKVIKKLERDGYYVLKLIKTNKNGISDLLALKKSEKPMFIEVKGERTPVTGLQEYRIKELQEYGFNAFILREATHRADQFLQR